MHVSNHDRAIRGCTLLLGMLPSNEKRDVIFALRGKAYASKDQHKQAIADFDRAIHLSPLNAGYFDFRGKSRVLMGQPHEGIDDFNIAISLDPAFDISYYNRAFAYSVVGQDSRAMEDLSRAIRLNPDEPLHYILRGDIYTEKGEGEKARHDYKKALSLPAKTSQHRAEQDALRARLAKTDTEIARPSARTDFESTAANLVFRHGVVRQGRDGGEAVAPFSIKTSPGANYFFKLVRSSDEGEQIAGFLVGGQPFSTKIPMGTYELRYAVGQKWINEQEYFGPKTAFVKADRLLAFHMEGNRVFGKKVELILQRGGNLPTSAIDKGEF